MKNKRIYPGILLVTLALCVSLCLGEKAFASQTEKESPVRDGWIMDGAGLLTESEEEALEEKSEQILSKYGVSAVIITTNRFEGSDILDWERKLFAEQGLGAGEKNSGLMLGISMEERDWGITAYGEAEPIFGAYSRETIGEEILDDLSDGDYYDSFDTFLDMTDTFLADAKEGRIYSESNPYKKKWNPAIIVFGSLVVSFFVSLVIVMIWKKAMNTRVLQDHAGAYLEQGSFALTNRSDIFLYHTVSRSRRQKEHSSSSGGGSMHSSGNGTSGKF